MKYIIRDNYLKSPLLVYDGPEPRKIAFRIKPQNVVFDLWRDAGYSYRQRISGEQIQEINSLLKLPITLFLDEMKPTVYYQDSRVEAYFTIDKEWRKYVVCYTLDEVSPMHYRCYILAVLEIVKE